jgi:hypothetical protein
MAMNMARAEEGLRCFSHNQPIASKYKTTVWLAHYSRTTNTIEHSSGSYTTLNGFRKAHIKSISPHLKGADDAWESVRCKVYGKWLRCNDIRRPATLNIVV